MRLHKDLSTMKTIIRDMSLKLNLGVKYIEKDYYVSLIVSEAMRRIPGLIFKGGTSLSKCQKIINRFSEDIDLTLSEEFFTKSNKRNAIHEILNVCEDLGFYVRNKVDILQYTHSNFARLYIEYDTLCETNNSPQIILEMAFIQKTFPYETSTINSMIGEFLSKEGMKDVINKYELNAATINVQSIERTLIDKVFAICDYYSSGNYKRNSRHIYDIYKLLDRIDLADPQMKDLVMKVREVRKNSNRSYSAQDGVDVPHILKEIIWNHSFENDYNTITKKLLYEHIEYEEAINGIYDVIGSKIFELPQSEKERIKS